MCPHHNDVVGAQSRLHHQTDVSSEHLLEVVTYPHFCVILADMRQHRPGLTPPQRVSAALLVDELSSSANAVREAEAKLAQARTERDAAIREASSLIPMLRLARIVGLSRDRLYKIVYSGTTPSTTSSETDPQ